MESSNIGGSITTTLGNVADTPFIGYGFLINDTPFCTCTLGHEWLVVVLGSSHTVNIPCFTAFIGAVLGIQGADFKAPGGCPSPTFTLTHRVVVTIG